MATGDTGDTVSSMNGMDEHMKRNLYALFVAIFFFV